MLKFFISFLILINLFTIHSFKTELKLKFEHKQEKCFFDEQKPNTLLEITIGLYPTEIPFIFRIYEGETDNIIHTKTIDSFIKDVTYTNKLTKNRKVRYCINNVVDHIQTVYTLNIKVTNLDGNLINSAKGKHWKPVEIVMIDCLQQISNIQNKIFEDNERDTTHLEFIYAHGFYYKLFSLASMAAFAFVTYAGLRTLRNFFLEKKLI